MLILYNNDYFDADYFERGQETGKSNYTAYHWMPRRSLREAFAFIDLLGLNENSRVLDYGCAKGFLVRAFRILEIPADGCDVSDYALSEAPDGCWKVGGKIDVKNKYTHIVCKDVFEHMGKSFFPCILNSMLPYAPYLACVVPLGDNGQYRIPAYHLDITHEIAEDEHWWKDTFQTCGWNVIHFQHHIRGIKDNWAQWDRGSGVFVLHRRNI